MKVLYVSLQERGDVKYVRLAVLYPSGAVGDRFILFPDQGNDGLSHARIVELFSEDAVSAGFVGEDRICSGKSESTGLESRPDDTTSFAKARNQGMVLYVGEHPEDLTYI